MAIAIFANAAKGTSALQLCRDLDVSYKTAFVLAHKLREAMATDQAKYQPKGEIEVDGAYFGGSIRQENYKADRKDRRLAEHQTGKRRVVVVMRERQGRSLPFVVRAEDEGVATVARRGRWCMEAGEVRVLLTPSPSGDTNRDRLGSPDHTVEHLDGDSSLTLLTSERAGTQPRADGRFIAADSGFRQTAATVAGGLLPSHSSLVADPAGAGRGARDQLEV